MELFNQHFWKFFMWFIAIMVLGFLALILATAYHNSEMANLREFENIENSQ